MLIMKRKPCLSRSLPKFPTKLYLHHEEDGVEDDEEHDEVLEGAGHHHPPQLVLEAVPLLGHVSLQGLGLDGEVNAGFLKC